MLITLRRLLCLSVGLGTFGVGTLPLDAAVIINANPGYQISWDGNDGRFSGQTVVPNNLANAAGSGALGSSELVPGGIHDIDNVHDSLYGNSNSWIAAGGDANPRIGVTLGGLTPVNGIAWGRANNNSNLDRTNGVYAIEYTTDPNPTLSSTWQTIGTVTYDATPQAGFTPHQRHEFNISHVGGNPIKATSVRLRNSNVATAIDEIEVYHDDARVANLGAQAWLRGDQGVLSSGGSVTRWSDRSGNANDATLGVAPNVGGTINGNTVVNFNSGNQHINLPQADTLGISNSDYEIFVLARSNDSGIQFLTAGGSTPNHFELHLNGSDGARFIANGGGGDAGYADIGRVGNFTDGQSHLFNIRVEGGTGYVSVDGVQGGDIITSAQSGANALLTLGIRGNVSFPFRGDMGEVIVFDRALSAGEREQVERYIMQRWNTVREVEFGGTMDAPNNLALASNGATPFAKDVLAGGAHAIHQIAHINDGVPGNNNSWIGAGLESFAGVALANGTYIDRIAFGRDNGGEAQVFTDARFEGTYTLQYTTVANPDASTLDADWITIADLIYSGNLGAEAYPNAPWLRHMWEFNPVYATGVRLLVNGVHAELAIDELEVYAAPVPEPSTLVLLGVGGMVGLCVARRRKRA